MFNKIVRSKRFVGGMIIGVIALSFFTYDVFAANTQSFQLVRSLEQHGYHVDTPVLSITGNMTIESWVKFNSLPVSGQQYDIVTKYSTGGGTRSYALLATGSGGVTRLLGVVSDDGSATSGHFKSLDIPYSFVTGIWYHVSYVFTPGSKVELFVNGVSIGSDVSDIPTGIYDNTADFAVGALRENGNFNFFDGSIDDVRLWNITRTVAQIQSDYQTELTGNEAGLVGYWKLNGSGADSTVNGDDLTLFGGASFSNDTPFGSAPAPRLVIRKSVDETISNSTTLQDDDELYNTLEANKTYVVTGTFFVTSMTARPDFKFAFSSPTGSTMNIGYITGSTAPSRGEMLQTSDTESQSITVPSNYPVTVQVSGTIKTGASAGNLKLEWAQHTANSTGVTMMQGSYIKSEAI